MPAPRGDGHMVTNMSVHLSLISQEWTIIAHSIVPLYGVVILMNVRVMGTRYMTYTVMNRTPLFVYIEDRARRIAPLHLNDI